MTVLLFQVDDIAFRLDGDPFPEMTDRQAALALALVRLAERRLEERSHPIVRFDRVLDTLLQK